MQMENLAILEPNIVGFTIIFMVVYLFGYFIIFKDWKQKVRSDASSTVMSLAHGTPAIVLSLYSMLQNSQTSFQHLDFSKHNSKFQEMVLEFSISYFICDTIHYLVFYPSNILFIAHHLATLYVLLTCRYVVYHGAATLIGLVVLAEITSPCQNTWSLARYRRFDNTVAANLYEKLSPYFYLLYSIVRGVLGPLFVYNMGLAFVVGKADGVISKPVWISWMVVIVSGILVSILWVINLWMGLFRERKKKELKKCN